MDDLGLGELLHDDEHLLEVEERDRFVGQLGGLGRSHRVHQVQQGALLTIKGVGDERCNTELLLSKDLILSKTMNLIISWIGLIRTA